MYLSYSFRLYPTRQECRALDRILEIHRQIYNAALQERREAWRRSRASIRYIDQSKQLKLIRTFDTDAAWCNHSSLQLTLRRLDKAFQDYFRRIRAGEKPGYPRFKGAGNFNSVRYTYGDGVRLRDRRLYLQNVGLLRIFQHRDLPEESAVKMAVIKRSREGNWFIILQLELVDSATSTRRGPAVGIDMGLTHFATLSTGEQVPNPRWFQTQERKLASIQQRRSRCCRGSRRYRELTRQFGRFHLRVSMRRKDFQHKLSFRLVREFGLIAVEDLNVKGLSRGRAAKSIGDASWARFLSMLGYKAERAGTRFVRVEPKGTSQYCARCAQLVPKTLSNRWHRCPRCGFTVPRDVNAALNILSLGMVRTGPPHKEPLASGGVAESHLPLQVEDVTSRASSTPRSLEVTQAHLAPKSC